MPDIGTLQQVQQGTVRISSVSSGTLNAAAIRIASVELPAEEYGGAYTITPGDTAQTIHINGKIATQDITIEKIPSNYGKINWSSNILTIT